MSSSTRSGGAASAGRQTLPDKKPERTPGEPPSPDSPLRSAGPLTRKRAASLRTDGPRIEDLSLNTPTAIERSPPQLPESGRDLICLCTPAPKVPRPRNGMSFSLLYHVFILLFTFIFASFSPCKRTFRRTSACQTASHTSLHLSLYLVLNPGHSYVLPQAKLEAALAALAP